MAAIAGQFVQDFKRDVDNPHLSAELDDLTEVVSQFDAYDWRSLYMDADRTSRVHVSNRWPISAQMRGHSFFDDFYNRIYITPGALDAGNLLSTQTRHIIVWNAFLVPKTMEDAVLGPQAGLELNYPSGVTMPYEMSPLRELDFTLQISLQGPPTIDSNVTFTVEGIDYVVPITGRRILLFPFKPTWGSPFDETVTMRSWAIESENGSEQTGSESGEIPRRQFEFNIQLRTASQAARAESLMFAWQSRFFGVPHWGEESRLDADIAAGSTTLPFDTYGLSLEPGTLVALYENEDNNEIREIATVGVDGVTITTGLQNDWPQGSRVYPCFVALMSDTASGSRETSKVARIPVMFECEPSVTPGNTALTVAPLTYRNEELYLGKTNWKSAYPFTFESDRMKVDAGTGKFASFSTSGFSKFLRRHSWNLYDRADLKGFREFLGRRQGVARAVYMQSGVVDFELVEPVLDSEEVITVKNTEYGALAGAHPARRDIIIILNDGTYFCRRITATNDVDNVTRLNIDSSLGVSIDVADVERISFLTLYRFQSNATTIRYLTDSKATVDAMLLAKRTKD